MNPPSIRRALLLRCGLGVGALLCLLSAGIYLLVRESLFREIDESIRQTAALLANQIELEDDSIYFEWQEGLGTNKALPADALFQYWNEADGTTTRSPGLRSRDLPRFSGVDGQPLLRIIRLQDGNHGRAIGLRAFPFVLPEEITAMRLRGSLIDPKSLPHILVVARDAEPVFRTLSRLRWILGVGSLLALAVGFAMIDRVVRVSLRPIDDLTAQMKDRAGHQLDSALELPEKLPIELDGLARNFDALLGRVAAIRRRERDFIRHAAHELRTPIAGLRATTDLALSQTRGTSEYLRHLEACRKTAIDLGELVKRLSALSRVGGEPVASSPEPLDLAKTIDECLQPFRPLASGRGLEIVTSYPASPLIVRADRALLRIILNNLFDNAVCYAAPEGGIRVHCQRIENLVEVVVSNRTDDLAEDPDRWFEPLFRKESSRHDAESHLGIGLTLSLDAARTLGGSLIARKFGDHGIGFVFSLPVPA